MARNLSAANAAAVEGEVWRPVILAHLKFTSIEVRLHNSVGDIEVGGETYRGVGDFGRVSPITENEEIKPGFVELHLTGLEQVPDAAVAADYRSIVRLRERDAPCTLWLGSINDMGDLVDDPWILVNGFAEAPSFTIGRSKEIKVRIESELRIFDRPNDARFNDTEHRQRSGYPTDGFFKHAPFVAEAMRAMPWARDGTVGNVYPANDPGPGSNPRHPHPFV